LKITARQLLQYRTAAALAAMIDGDDSAAKRAEPQQALPTLGEFKRGKRATQH
jgi:hypothetical protein